MTHEEALATYGEVVVEWHRCVAIEESNPEAFGLAETAQEQVRACEKLLSEAEIDQWAAAIAAQLILDDQDDYFVVEDDFLSQL